MAHLPADAMVVEQWRRTDERLAAHAAQAGRDDDPAITCQSCTAAARWAVCNLEGPDSDPITRAHACGRHLHGVLEAMDWDMDCVHLYDLSVPVDAF